jgi:Lar family restriction alleviation protein
MSELLPCPFCGGPANLSDGYPRLYRPGYNKVAVECPECGLVFGWDCDYGGCFETTEEAAAEWNRRAQSKEDNTNAR